MNKDEALKSIKNGAIAASISALLTFIVVVIAIKTDSSGEFAIFNDPMNFFDLGLMIICAIGIFKKSRIAAVTLLIYFISAKIMIAFDTGKVRGIGVSLVFVYFYAKAVQGTFTFHKMEKTDNPEYKPTSKLWWFLGIPAALAFGAVLVISLMSTTGLIPSTRVLSEAEISPSTIKKLQEYEIISDTDQVLYFYGQGLTLEESGNVLTQNQVILYYQNENNDIESYAISLDQVTGVILEEEGSVLDDSIYKVITDDPDTWISLFLSKEQKGDEKFVAGLREKISKN